MYLFIAVPVVGVLLVMSSLLYLKYLEIKSYGASPSEFFAIRPRIRRAKIFCASTFCLMCMILLFLLFMMMFRIDLNLPINENNSVWHYDGNKRD